jgi:hypothetical protein
MENFIKNEFQSYSVVTSLEHINLIHSLFMKDTDLDVSAIKVLKFRHFHWNEKRIKKRG